jgi:hypothetical protein
MVDIGRDERLRRVFARLYLGIVLALIAFAGAGLLGPLIVSGWQKASTTMCRLQQPLAAIALPEASGIAASRRNPGTFWAVNDSGGPFLVAIDGHGVVKGRVRVPGATVRDWEDLAIAPCDDGSCIYIADIGDNSATRDTVTIYRIPEPAPTDRETTGPTTFEASYPDGAHDAETLLVMPDARMFIVTKGATRGVGVYRFPAGRADRTTVHLQRVGALTSQSVDGDERITGGAASADGRWIVLRTHEQLSFYRALEFTTGSFREAAHADVRAIRERQGEGVTFAAGDEVWLVSEGGGDGRPGTLARLACDLPQ